MTKEIKTEAEMHQENVKEDHTIRNLAIISIAIVLLGGIGTALAVLL
ncbi:hypothetical protein [Weissella muntiaci]|nr:hypothetical protein [Weissella muntiaci]